ncbi:FKBP-type peptidyl-prolyl cis-trans isomerase [Candidatus Cardinium sp. TP]|uniref:FKBP-type peptidyl-prolyl cis-trans isomerase n=1 Tax=Candidatus Cardinium sp. TP TaxID=2961955 RepID=UPI0021AFEBF3|nr:FKBP-type peptidyl-prolyl cis-trans isomerase [Candidatus Cardinium sp. TP]MCT4697421.1 FKBP-type peptidyl-prolyl cis-trans isomerase [Candidatus Cardinium sp. TP]MDN5247310.1 FKBP-type peptidyl-prolyl cis-trans isomerase [Candidatus Cardinium sp.]
MKPKVVCAWIFMALVIGLFWYNHQYHCYGYPFLSTPSGLSYKSIGKKSNGRKVKDGEWIELSFVMKASHKKGEKDKKSGPKEIILINRPEPFFLQFEPSLQSENKKLAEMIGMMQGKQRMVFKCAPADYLEEKDPERLEQILKQFDLNKEDEFVMDIKLNEIMTDEAYHQMLETRRTTQLAKDKQLITDYLAAHHIEASTTDSGLFYSIDQPSDAMLVGKGKTIKVHYTGRLLDGTVFDTSLEEVAKAHNIYNAQRPYQPFEFKVGLGYVIKGWDEGLLLLKKHEKARFFIPSALAYGPNAIGKLIPANSILLFEVEVVDVLESDPSKTVDASKTVKKEGK